MTIVEEKKLDSFEYLNTYLTVDLEREWFVRDLNVTNKCKILVR